MKILTLQPSPLVSHVWRRWRDDITTAGKCLAVAVALAGMGSVSVQVPIYQIFCGLVALLVVTEFVGFLYRPRVTLQGRFRERTSVGDTLRAEMLLTNQGRWPAFDLEVGFFDPAPETVEVLPPQMLPRLAPGESAPVPTEIRLLRRGWVHLPELYVYSTFPFNLRRFGSARVSLPPILVTPKFPRVSVESTAMYQGTYGDGTVASDRAGESVDFLGNREYVPGEPLRRLDFRSWARVGKPVVREYQEDLHGRMALVIDHQPLGTSRRQQRSTARSLDAAVSLAAGICDDIGRRQHVVRIFAGNQAVFEHSATVRQQFDDLLDALAPISVGDRSQPIDWDDLAVNLSTLWDATVVVILLRWDEARAAFLQRLRGEGLSVLPILIGTGGSAEANAGPDSEVRVVTRAQVFDGGTLRL